MPEPEAPKPEPEASGPEAPGAEGPQPEPEPERDRPVTEIYTLLVEVGRRPGDGLPEGATGAALLCYAAGRDEAEAVRETVAVLRQAEMAPLDVSGYGTLAERLAEGHDIDAEERALMARARAEDAVIVAQATPFYDPPGGTPPGGPETREGVRARADPPAEGGTAGARSRAGPGAGPRARPRRGG